MDLTRVSTQLVAPATSLFSGGQPLDLIALADLALELNLTGTTDYAYLSKLITRASRAAQRYCNRTLVPALWQDRVWPAKDHYPWQLPPGLSKLQLQQFPLAVSPSSAGTAPPQAPTLSAVAGGSLPAATYYVRTSYVTPTGETGLSLESSLSCSADTLLSVAAPGADALGVATGWNIYVGNSSFGETKQNSSPIGLGVAWTLPTSGLTSGSAPPAYVTIVENAGYTPTPLTEGLDYIVDPVEGQVDRLWYVDGSPKSWGFPVTAIYNAGYSTIPDDLQEAVILLAKMRWFARNRDPMLRSQSVPGIYEAQYWLGTGLGGQGDLPVDVTEKLDRFRVPVVA